MLARVGAGSLLCYVALIIAAGPRRAFTAEDFVTAAVGGGSVDLTDASRGLVLAFDNDNNGNSSTNGTNNNRYYYHREAAFVNGTNATSSSQRELRYPKKWVARIFYDTLVDFTVAPDVGSSACQRQTDMYIRHLANDSMWAVQSEWS